MESIQYIKARQNLKAIYDNVICNKLSFVEYQKLSLPFWESVKREVQADEYILLTAYSRGCYYLIIDNLIQKGYRYTTRSGNARYVTRYADLPKYIKARIRTNRNYVVEYACWISDPTRPWLKLSLYNLSIAHSNYYIKGE